MASHETASSQPVTYPEQKDTFFKKVVQIFYLPDDDPTVPELLIPLMPTGFKRLKHNSLVSHYIRLSCDNLDYFKTMLGYRSPCFKTTFELKNVYDSFSKNPPYF